jgi:hypothetical protein
MPPTAVTASRITMLNDTCGKPYSGDAAAALVGRFWIVIGVGLGGGHRRALGAVILLLMPIGGHASERLTAR